MFEFIKKVFFTGLTILASVNPLTATPLKCTSMNIQEWKVKPQFVNLNRDEPVCFFLVLKQVNAIVVATISIIHTQNWVFLMLLEI